MHHTWKIYSYLGNDCFAVLSYKHGYFCWKQESYTEDPARSDQDGEGLAKAGMATKKRLRELDLFGLVEEGYVLPVVPKDKGGESFSL